MPSDNVLASRDKTQLTAPAVISAKNSGQTLWRGGCRSVVCFWRLSVIDRSLLSRPVEVTGICRPATARRLPAPIRNALPPGALTWPSAQATCWYREKVFAVTRSVRLRPKVGAIFPDSQTLTSPDAMLLAGHHTESWTSTEEDSSGMRLRVRGGNAAEQLIHLRFGKTTIGSSPRCDVRIQQTGVRPVHLLIVREPRRVVGAKLVQR